jgi:hypothetical protein
MADIEDAVADAYVWGCPLVTMRRTCARHGGVGQGMFTRSELATPADRTVVAPNNDTLYASGWFDLGAGDLTVEVEPMGDRYWSVMLLDAYTHVRYVCRRLHGSAGARVRVTYDPTPPVAPPADRATDVIPLGTPTVWVLARVLVDGPTDLAAARAAATHIHIHQPPAPTPSAPPPASAESRVGGAAAAGGAVGWVEELRGAVAGDPPAAWHPGAPGGLEGLLADPPGDEVVAAGIEKGKARIAASFGIDCTGNGWGTRRRGADFGDDVAYRAAFARFSLAGHLPAENRSYTRRIDGSTPVTLRFPPGPGGEPPVDGFWSLCLYGPDLFFVANEIDRYSIGDRTPRLRRDADGGLTLTIGHERPADPANWLPAPVGPAVLALRAYEGHPAIVDATWFPPALTPLPEP